MATSYFTLGQNHLHVLVDGEEERIIDSNTVIKITAENPRERIFSLFGPKWSMEYNEPPEMSSFPGGIYELGDHVTIDTRRDALERLKEKVYLGDGAYVAFDGYHVVLTAENGIEATDTVALDPGCLTSLTRYLAGLDEGIEEFNKNHRVNKLDPYCRDALDKFLADLDKAIEEHNAKEEVNKPDPPE